ncbi:MAG: TIGR04282 family arsenosugar biosynthesis glycosyltransferase [Pseudohongiellaceae bacterium]|jgi:rSAM/selenodomain-associated transferase 1
MTACRFPDARLLLFAREPVAGRVKTRLQPALTAAGSLELHRALLARTAQTLAAAQLAPWQLWVDANPEHPDFLALRGAAGIHLQQGPDLGARMQHAAARTLAETAVDTVVLIGADCPAVDAAYVAQALEALADGAEVVLGPAEDGGYVLLGMRQARAELFANVPWGKDTVFTATLANLEAINIAPAILETRWDVDRPADLQRLSELQPPLALSPDLSALITDLVRDNGADY